MVISSPGEFPEGVSADNILSVAPTPRNRTLAEAVKRIGLAERTGRGVDKIYSAMLRSGHEIPDYSDSSAARRRLDERSRSAGSGEESHGERPFKSFGQQDGKEKAVDVVHGHQHQIKQCHLI